MKKNKLIAILIILIAFLTFNNNTFARELQFKSSISNNYYVPQIAKNVEGTTVSGGGGSKAKQATSEGIDLCDNAGLVKSIQIVGWCLFVLKIVTPIVLIIVGSITLGKAVVAGDDNAIKSAVSSLVKKAIAAVVVFFVPTIVVFVFSLVAGASDTMDKYECLTNCLGHPGECAIPDNDLFN